MQRLQEFPLDESVKIKTARRQHRELPEDAAAQIDLGVALADSGCSYEAAAVLRPLRLHWKTTAVAERARGALEAQAWWNKHWREFAQLKRAGKNDAALKLLGDRAVLYWDLPPLLVHLGDVAAAREQLDLSNHLYQRVFDLSQRGLPKMNMAAFEYVAQAALVHNLLRSGRADEALSRHRAIKPNPGNAMAHEIQTAVLLVATGLLDQAMCHVASMLVTAGSHRSGYGKTMRIDFIEKAAELAPLRMRNDWAAMRNDPATYRRQLDGN